MKRTNLSERWNLGGLEHQLEKMSKKGYQIEKVGRHILTFRRNGVKNLTYRIDVMSDYYMDDRQYEEDLRERQELYREKGWHHSVGYKKMNDTTMKYYHIYYSYQPVQSFPGDDMEGSNESVKRVMKEERRQLMFAFMFALIQCLLYVFVGVVFKNMILQVVEGVGIIFIAFIWMNLIDLILAAVEIIQVNRMLYHYEQGGKEEVLSRMKSKKRKVIEYIVWHLRLINYLFISIIVIILFSVNMFLPHVPELRDSKYVTLQELYPNNKQDVTKYVSKQTSPFLSHHVYAEVSYKSSDTMITTEVFQLYFKELAPLLANDLLEKQKGYQWDRRQLSYGRYVYINYNGGGKILMYAGSMVIVVKYHNLLLPRERMILAANKIMDEWNKEK